MGFTPVFFHKYTPRHEPQKVASISQDRDDSESGCESSVSDGSCSSSLTSSSVPIRKRLSSNDGSWRKATRIELKQVESRINVENAQREQSSAGRRKISVK